MENIAVSIEDVSIRFNMQIEKIDNLKEYFVKMLKGKVNYKEFWALNDVSFQVQKGEVFGLVGLNGAGKSTLLKVIAGVLKPTKGKVAVNGSIVPLIELGAGFDMELSARENIYLNGAILGYDKKFIAGKFEEIVDFAETREFLDVPLKNYSSGMLARIAFAISTVVEPDILIVDEILAVGDYKFQEKCMQRIEQMLANGVTVLFVSHSTSQVEQLCSRVAYLEKGRVVEVGPTAEVLEKYLK
ncbi:ABC transporter [Paenibacillus sp. FSL R7-269]|uniref:ABC transporter ATP-binding protein n=1 Tax=Paenibacillus sp. FSL R7-269 TaxID=1226755 RepID=UPI0003E1CF43|nr:ABC transporter ATP-binding protein [Paenibacillus sp. FSL R7-269]ETT50044.1 ABC transporter [Paenibacillus sp. FSL R7-269]